MEKTQWDRSTQGYEIAVASPLCFMNIFLFSVFLFPFFSLCWSEPRREFGAGRDDGGIALRAGGDHADFDAKLVRDEFHVIPGGLRQRAGVLDAVRGAAPTRQRAVVGCHRTKLFHGSGHFADGRAMIAVSDANLDLALCVEDVELGDHERIDSV